MKKIFVKTKKTIPDKKERRLAEMQRRKTDDSIWLFSVFLVGIMALIYVVCTVLNLNFAFFAMLSGYCDIVAGVYWYLYFYRTKIYNIVSYALIALTLLDYAPKIYLLTVLTSEGGVSTEGIFSLIGIDGLLILIALLLHVLLALEFSLRSHAAMFLIVTAALIAPPVFGYESNTFVVIALLTYQIGFMVLNMTEPASGKRRFTMPTRAKSASAVTVLSAALATILAIASIPFVYVFQTDLYDKVAEADTAVKDALSQLTGIKADGINNGVINRGNLNQSGQLMLHLQTDQIPQEKLYLHGFSSDVYYEGMWQNAFSTAESMDFGNPYNRMIEGGYRESAINLVLSEIINHYRGYYSPNLYNKLNDLLYNTSDPVARIYYENALSTALSSDNYEFSTSGISPPESLLSSSYGDVAPTQINIIHNSRKYYSLYIPYYAQADIASLWYGRRVDRESGYLNSFFTQEQINANGAFDKELPSTSKFFNALDSDEADTVLRSVFLYYYKQTIQSFYTTVIDNDSTRRMRELVAATPLDSLDEITTYILVTLQNRAEYTTSPGNTPFNKDVIDYFLFDNGKGYCQHFASAAVMLYRMYGIPARYVSGFVVSPEQFISNSPDENGTVHFSADITDMQAHAWVEIYLDDYGWVPVEVTPTAERRMICTYPGYDSAKMRRIMQEHGWSFVGITDDTQQSSGTDNDGNFVYDFMSGIRLPVYIFFGVHILILIGIVIFLLIRRHRRLSSLSTASCRKLFGYIISALHYGGFLVDYNGSEDDFVHQLSSVQLPNGTELISGSDADRLIEIMQCVSFSPRKASRSEHDFIVDTFRSISLSIYLSLPLYKRPLYRLFKALL